MEERHAAQRAQKKEFERERAAVDEIVRKIHEEDHSELVRITTLNPTVLLRVTYALLTDRRRI
jgi:hypothetical protein